MDELCHNHALKLQESEKRIELLEKALYPIQKDIKTIKNASLLFCGAIIYSLASQSGFISGAMKVILPLLAG